MFYRVKIACYQGIRRKGEFRRGVRKEKIRTTWRARGEARNRGGESEAAGICFMGI